MRSSRLFSQVLLVAVSVAFWGAAPLPAQGLPAAPFRVGGDYRIVFVGHMGDFRVLAPPNASGLMAAVLISSPTSLDLFVSPQPLWINVRMALVVQEVSAQPVSAQPRAQPITREDAYVASMKSDLRNLVTAEEAFFADSIKYTARIGSGGLQFAVTTGNSLPVIRLTADGWAATIRNANTRTVCAIFIGRTPTPPATNEGEPKCQ